MRPVAREIAPEPEEAERKALLTALDRLEREHASPYESEWRRSGVDVGAPSPWPAPRIRRGATRA